MNNNRTDTQSRISACTRKTVSMFISTLPIILGMVMLTGLLVEFLPTQLVATWFGRSDLADAAVGALAGSFAVGHPLTSYVLGGELLTQGISLVAVTAFLLSWVTVGSIQLPAEAVMLGKRFALYHNLICFLLAIIIALLTAGTVNLLGPL